VNPDDFEKEVRENIERQGEDRSLRQDSVDWMVRSAKYKYSYNFRWLGRPIIQFPQDIVALQEIIWTVRPGAIVETGIAHGGSLILSASILELIGRDGVVVGVDIEIKPHNREAILAHPMAKRIELIEGSSVDTRVVEQVRKRVEGKTPVMVLLDSNHSHKHVLEELRRYSGMVSKDSYIVVFDTLIENVPEDLFADRAWGKGNSPKTAVETFLAESDRFQADHTIEDKLLITVAPGGFLRCVRS